jgi:peptidoglycan/LPS O-acetylase OafA/YrhL
VSRRLTWVDALRGLAALLVLAQHALERLQPGFRDWTGRHLQVGQLGVTVFFLVSGLVVPGSLERAGGLRSFWASRFFRLWPAYWVSLAGVLLVHQLGRHPYPPDVRHSLTGTYLANLTMGQAYLHRPDLLGVYWTLAFELAFYAALTAVWLLGLTGRSTALAVLACGGAVGLSALGRLTDHHVPLGVANLATMFVGTVMWRWRSGEVSTRTAWSVFALGAAAGQLVLALQLAGRGVDSTTGDPAGWAAFAAAWLLAYLLVAGGLLLPDLPWPRALVSVGLWSYALYLFHPLVFDILRDAPGPALVVAGQWCAGAVLLAAVVHHVVERPAIRLGRDVTARRRAPAPSQG